MKFSLEFCCNELKSIPGILNERTHGISYKNTVIVGGSSLSYSTIYTTNALEILQELGYSTSEITSTEQLRIWLIQALYLKECKVPKASFKTGNVRKSVVEIFRYLKIKAEWHMRTPLMMKFRTEITEAWPNLTDTAKRELSPYFEETGVFSISVRRNILLSDGTVNTEYIRENQYKECNAFIRTNLGLVFIPVTSPTIHTETITESGRHSTEKTQQFTAEEWKWFTYRYRKCSSCGSWDNKYEFLFDLCTICTQRTTESFRLELQNYSARATDFFQEICGKHPKYSPHLLGVELEYEQKAQTSQKETLFLLNQTLGKHAIFKRDGSLTNGVEICTRPASIDIHLDECAKMYGEPKLWERLEVLPTCGMHVHIDRRKMTALTLGKLIAFMQQKQNQEFLEVIGERTSNRFSILGNDFSVTSGIRGIAAGSRYTGLNITNANTAEIRIFKTPSDFNTFQKNLEFVSALVSFVQPANSGIKDTHYGAFLNFVNNQNTYKALRKFHKENF